MPRKRERDPRFLPAKPISFEGKTVILMPELLGRVLSLLRRRLDVGQRDMADELFWPQSVVSKVERGGLHTTVTQLDAYVAALNRFSRKYLGDRHGWTLNAWQAMHLADLVRASIASESKTVFVWATEREFEEEICTRGRELVDLVRAHWPDEYRSFL